MKIKSLLVLALAGFVLVSTLRAGSFAAAVVNYNPGAGFTPGYTNAGVVLGPPSTVDSYGDAVDPFDPAYATNQILSLGANGSLTIEFAQPIVSGVPGNPFGLDFIIFGNSFFVVTNAMDDDYNYIGIPSTDGTVYSDPCQATVSVSSDGVTFYKLNPALAPQINDLYPTDGTGNFQLPVNPALTNFAGLDLAQIRGLYNGSAGGAGYAISWAQDAGGNSVSLFEVRYVRVDVQSGEALIAGFAAVSNANRVIVEDFSHDPALDGWQYFGDTGLFAWSQAGKNLQVTWDSSQPNSYFYHPLGTVLGTNDDFSFSFDLVLTDYAATGFSFPVAAGMQNFGQAVLPDFLIDTGSSQTNVAEFDFFPAPDPAAYPGQLPSVGPTFVDSSNNFGAINYAYVPLPTGMVMRVSLNYTASNETGVVTITTNGVAVVSPPASVNLGAPFGDYFLDTFAVESYSDAGPYPATVLAHGTIGNVLIVVPPPPVTLLQVTLAGGVGQMQFASRTNWNYILQSSADLQNWRQAAPTMAGTGGALILQDTNSVQPHQYYRVNAVRAD